jgi:hypothetical protein
MLSVLPACVAFPRCVYIIMLYALSAASFFDVLLYSFAALFRSKSLPRQCVLQRSYLYILRRRFPGPLSARRQMPQPRGLRRPTLLGNRGAWLYVYWLFRRLQISLHGWLRMFFRSNVHGGAVPAKARSQARGSVGLPVVPRRLACALCRWDALHEPLHVRREALCRVQRESASVRQLRRWQRSPM